MAKRSRYARDYALARAAERAERKASKPKPFKGIHKDRGGRWRASDGRLVPKRLAKAAASREQGRLARRERPPNEGDCADLIADAISEVADGPWSGLGTSTPDGRVTGEITAENVNAGVVGFEDLAWALKPLARDPKVKSVFDSRPGWTSVLMEFQEDDETVRQEWATVVTGMGTDLLTRLVGLGKQLHSVYQVVLIHALSIRFRQTTSGRKGPRARSTRRKPETRRSAKPKTARAKNPSRRRRSRHRN